jgi:hypothetical protein
MSFFKLLSNKLVQRIDFLVLKYLTVERGRNKRKWIWQTKNFKEVTQMYIPRCIFIGFVVIMCWKIHDRVKAYKREGNNMYYEAKSRRQERLEEETKVKKIIEKYFF